MSKSKEILKANEVSAPTLFVGVGGTGCKIVKKLQIFAHLKKRKILTFCALTQTLTIFLPLQMQNQKSIGYKHQILRP